MFVAVFLSIAFTKFQQKVLFHSVVMFTKKEMSDILLLFALLIVFPCLLYLRYYIKKKLEDSTRIFGMKFNDQTVTYLFLAKWFTCFKTANNNQNLFSKFESLRRDE